MSITLDRFKSCFLHPSDRRCRLIRHPNSIRASTNQGQGRGSNLLPVVVLSPGMWKRLVRQPLSIRKKEKMTADNFLNFCGFVVCLLHFIILSGQKPPSLPTCCCLPDPFRGMGAWWNNMEPQKPSNSPGSTPEVVKRLRVAIE